MGMTKTDVVICVVLGIVGIGYLLGAGYYAVTYDDQNNNCKHQSIAFHDWLSEHGIENHYAGVRESPTVGHVWVIVDVGCVGVPVETTSLGTINPLEIRRYLRPDWGFASTEEMLIGEGDLFEQR